MANLYNTPIANYQIDLEAQTATSINGITFKMTKRADGKYSGAYLNPKGISPDDLFI